MLHSIGGHIQLSLLSKHPYSVEEVKSMAVKEFMNGPTRILLEQSSIKGIGNLKGEIISSFTNATGKKCDFWEYSKAEKKPPNKMKLYLLTVRNANASVSLDLQTPPPSLTHSSLMRSVDSAKEDSRLSHLPISIPSASSVRFDNHDFIPPFVNIQVFYRFIRKSQCTNDVCYTQYDREQLFMEALCNGANNRLPQAVHDFEPFDFGYDICKIVKGGKVLLEIENDDKGKRVFQFPSSEQFRDHEIIYNVDELHGVFNGRLSVGVIPRCTDLCKPYFPWYKDGDLFKGGEFL